MPATEVLQKMTQLKFGMLAHSSKPSHFAIWLTFNDNNSSPSYHFVLNATSSPYINIDKGKVIVDKKTMLSDIKGLSPIMVLSDDNPDYTLEDNPQLFFKKIGEKRNFDLQENFEEFRDVCAMQYFHNLFLKETKDLIIARGVATSLSIPSSFIANVEQNSEGAASLKTTAADQIDKASKFFNLHQGIEFIKAATTHLSLEEIIRTIQTYGDLRFSEVLYLEMLKHGVPEKIAAELASSPIKF